MSDRHGIHVHPEPLQNLHNVLISQVQSIAHLDVYVFCLLGAHLSSRMGVAEGALRSWFVRAFTGLLPKAPWFTPDRNAGRRGRVIDI